jgi:DNA-binding NarL/FixJ family response regulator
MHTTPASSSPAARSRILVVDDHPVMRESVSSMLSRPMGWAICGQAGTVQEARELIAHVQPDMVVCDLSLRGGNGFALMRDVLPDQPEMRFLILSMHRQEIHAEPALRLGARGYVMKGDSARLVPAVRDVLQGRVSVDPIVAERAVAAITQPRNGKPPLLSRLSAADAELFNSLYAAPLEKIAKDRGTSLSHLQHDLRELEAKLNLPAAAIIGFSCLMNQPKDRALPINECDELDCFPRPSRARIPREPPQ